MHNNYVTDEVSNMLVDDEGALGFEMEEPDELFGLGNKKKQAERKLAKAERKLAKGKTKAAARLTKQADKRLSRISTGLQKALGTKQTLAEVNQTQANLNTMNTQANESMNTAPGQIGETAMPPTVSAQQAQTSQIPISGGGGGADLPYPDSTAEMTDSPYYNQAQEQNTQGEQTPQQPTPTSKGKNIILICAVIVIVIAAIIYFSKHNK